MPTVTVARRGLTRKKYHYKLINSENNNEIEYFKTTSEIIEKYNISRPQIYLMCKIEDRPIIRRKYAHLKIEKINLHYLTVEHGIDAALITL
jgi:hypothetical protein